MDDEEPAGPIRDAVVCQTIDSSLGPYIIYVDVLMKKSPIIPSELMGADGPLSTPVPWHNSCIALTFKNNVAVADGIIFQ